MPLFLFCFSKDRLRQGPSPGDATVWAEPRVPVGTLTPHRAGSAWEYGLTLKNSSVNVRAPADSARPASHRMRDGGLLTHCFLVFRPSSPTVRFRMKWELVGTQKREDWAQGTSISTKRLGRCLWSASKPAGVQTLPGIVGDDCAGSRGGGGVKGEDGIGNPGPSDTCLPLTSSWCKLLIKHR